MRVLIAIVVVLVSLLATLAAPSPAMPVADGDEFDCWSKLTIPCQDCEGEFSHFCNPNSEGNLVACMPAESSMCELGKGCTNITGTTGSCD